MRIRRSLRFLLVFGVVGLLAASCGSSKDSLSTDEPTPEPTAKPSDGGDGDSVEVGDPTATPADTDEGQNTEPTTQPVEPTPVSDPVLLSVFTSGGFVPIEVALGAFPEIVVMADGTVYRPGAQIAIFPGPLVPSIEKLQLSAEALAQVEVLATSQAINASFDFGSPRVADLGTTLITTGYGTSASIYALAFENGVSEAQAEARSQLSTLVREVTAIVDDAAGTGEITTPPALALLSFPGLGFQEDSQVFDWPLNVVPQPQPQAGGADCVLVDGDDLQTMWDAAASANSQTPWNINGEAKVIVLRPVFPNEDIC